MNEVQVDIQALAKLARLEVSGDELAKLEKEIPNILGFVETIQAASADSVSNATKAVGLHNVLRPDENPHETGEYTERLLAAAPAREGNRVAVKQVLTRKKN